MNKFKRDLDEFAGEEPRFNEPLKRRILNNMKEERRSPNRFGTFQSAAVLVLLLTVATLFLVLNLNGDGAAPTGPTGTTDELPALTDADTVEEIEIFTEYEEPQEVFEFGYDGMDRGNYEYYEHPLLIDPEAYQEKEPARGDVIIHESEFFDGKGRTVSRIIALPGETVEVVDGQIYINDQKLETFYGQAHRRGYSSNEEYNEALIKGGASQNIDSMKDILSQSIEAFTLGEGEVYVTGDDWFRSRQETVKVDEIEAEVLGYYINSTSTSISISKEEAEEIALKRAKADNYDSPKMWDRYGSETHLVPHYSKTYEKDVETWGVYLDTADNPEELNTPALIYYISKDTGEVIDVIVGAVSN